LTSRSDRVRSEIIASIVRLSAIFGFPPTAREMNRMMGKSSYGSTYEMLRRMKRDGLVDFEPGRKCRTLRVTRKGMALIEP
jgi:Mn-dependent DtxR family transcriptional regulator